MSQTGVMKVKTSDGWELVGFPNEPDGGVFKVHDGSLWHIADNEAVDRSGRLKVKNEDGDWQHASWMRTGLVLRGYTEHDHNVGGTTGSDPFVLPVDTQVGDLLVLSVSPTGHIVSDARLTDYGNGCYVGFATDLSDIPMTRTTTGFCQAALASFINYGGSPDGSNNIVTSSNTLDMPVVSGVRAAVACLSSTHSTVAGYLYPSDRPPWQIANPGTKLNHAGLAWWDDQAASATPATPVDVFGGSGTRRITVVGLV